MTHLRLSSLERTAPLSDDEAVRLGRLLIPRLGVTLISLPDDVASATVLVRDAFDDGLPDVTARALTQVLGDFNVTTFSEWATRPSDRLVTPETPGVTTLEEPAEPMIHILAPGRGATVLGARLLDKDVADDRVRAGDSLRVVFPGLPLSLWRQTVEAGVAADADHAGVGYEVLTWEAGSDFEAPTGAPLHEVYATLRRVTISRG